MFVISGFETMELFGLSEIQIVGVAVAAVVVAATAAIVFSSKKSKGLAARYDKRQTLSNFCIDDVDLMDTFDTLRN